MFTQEESEKIRQAENIFNGVKLTREQINAILKRNITDEEWILYITPPPIYNPSLLFQLAHRAAALDPLVAATKAVGRAAAREARRRYGERTVTYTIERLSEYRVATLNVARTSWRIAGDVNLFQINNAIEALLNSIIQYYRGRGLFQIMMQANDIVRQTKLLTIEELKFL